MTNNTLSFDHWIRSRFIDLNTSLEKMYYMQEDKANVVGVGQTEKISLRLEGEEFIKILVAEGNTDEGFDNAFDLLGNVGLFMAACRRHELTEPSRESSSPLIEASALAMQIGASIGVTPRFATAHLTTHNKAINGKYKRFTHLACEELFINYNTKGILAYKRAADALLKILPLGISHHITAELLVIADQALNDVIVSNEVLFEHLNEEEFFYQVRPYYKPYYVGSNVYRGANAGDFAGINVIDMLLGLCFANEPDYSQILVDKFLYMMPEDQQILRDCMRRPNLMDDFIASAQYVNEDWYQMNLTLFLDVCKRHGDTAILHHHMLVGKYITNPAKKLEQKHMGKITASGPPLHELLASLENLKDRRSAAKRTDLHTRFEDINQLRSTLTRSIKLS